MYIYILSAYKCLYINMYIYVHIYHQQISDDTRERNDRKILMKELDNLEHGIRDISVNLMDLFRGL
jgi:hypothetical protein